MSRRRKTIKRGITPDPKYNSELVAKVIRSLMRSGKKTTSERIVYGAIAELGEKTGEAAPPEGLVRLAVPASGYARIGWAK